ncbi:membrane-associated phosphatidylinositol transfer protein 2-like isoform X2 [Apostichopus japonicus]|uniref:membrane-associated phosphatidylinositol transfer protein 2-like isoform X2 n=1 Tax=Stichopus japonicus TaxID=307972 RepID=UPI003AB716A7
MLIKEYRIPLPFRVEEYRIAQLYMIQKKSRQESKGAGSGVEILVNRPYENGPGGCGQYTHKIYHIGSHMPGWFRAILPKTALMVEEESWNAYPYTRTRYTTPFIEKFSLDVETKYLPDAGHQENVFNLSPSEMKNRVIDLIDMVNDPVASGDYSEEEDPTIYVSQKTERGPLSSDWIKTDSDNNFIPQNGCTDIMCAYKLIRVEFRYWGMQNRIEKFIHDVALRKTMLHAHRQAWCWQDEWCDLKMEDIRQLEQEAARELQEKMAAAHMDEEMMLSKNGDLHESLKAVELRNDSQNENRLASSRMDSLTSDYTADGSVFSMDSPSNSFRESRRRLSQRLSSDSKGSDQHIIAHWRMNSIRQESDGSEDEDEFYDAQDWLDEEQPPPVMTHWSSEDMLHGIDPDGNSQHVSEDGSPAASESNESATVAGSEVNILLLILHGGNVLDGMQDPAAKNSDINTFKAAFDAVIPAHFPVAQGRLAFRMVPCPSTCCEVLSLLSKLSPRTYSNQSYVAERSFPFACVDSVPLDAIPILATSSAEYTEVISTTVTKMNIVYQEFLKSEEGQHFNGEVCVVGDCMGAILGYDAICRGSYPAPSRSSTATFHSSSGETLPQLSISKTASMSSTLGSMENDVSNKHSMSSNDIEGMNEVVRRRNLDHVPRLGLEATKRYSSPTFHSIEYDTADEQRRYSQTSITSDMMVPRLEFEVVHFFSFGSPLGLVLAYRDSIQDVKSALPPKPVCYQMYNLFHRTDPSAMRIEPLIAAKFSLLPPASIPRYQKFPLGDGHSHDLFDCVSSNDVLFSECHQEPGLSPPPGARSSTLASSSSEGGDCEALFYFLQTKWWGCKRLDYALYCPEALQAFPTGALPHLFHASYWESTDVVAFLLRQVFQQETVSINTSDGTTVALFTPSQPREKWQRKRTSMKMKQSVHPNHRGKDAIILEGSQQLLSGRFMYSNWDMVTLTGEKVDLHIMTQPPLGEWVYFGTEVTNSSGWIQYIIPESRRLTHGVYPVKMVVRGDHTYADCYLTVVPPSTECVVFSIDGSFTASVSIMGKDPKVRAGAVDVVRHWQELNYLIIYVTARPSMQKAKVVKWLAQHNFPHGMVSFCDGITTDPLRQKASYLKHLVEQTKISIHKAYGSNKDIWVYTSVNLQPAQIYIVGKVSKKYQNQVQMLNTGYAAHLEQLAECSRPAVGNSRLILRRGCFSLPGQLQSHRPAKQPAHRTASYHGTAASRALKSKDGSSKLTREGRISEGDVGPSVRFEV